MRKISFFLFIVFCLIPEGRSETCISRGDYNQSRSLFSADDYQFFNTGIAARERSCAREKNSAFAKCVEEKLNQKRRSNQVKICDSSNSSGKSSIDNIRNSCGRELAEKRLPNCPASEYSFPSCKQFEGDFSYTNGNKCISGNILPQIGELGPIAEKMTRREREKSVLFNIRDNLVKQYESALRPMEEIRACIAFARTGQKDKVIEMNGKQVKCAKIVDFMMVKVLMKLPLLRQHQILSNGPHLRSRGQDQRSFARQLRRNFRGETISDEEVRELGEHISLNRRELPVGSNPPATLNELKEAAAIRKEQFAYRDQQFLEAHKDKEPFKDCVIEKEGRLEFIGSDQGIEALKCGLTERRDELKITNTIFTKADELNMPDADSMRAHDAFLSYRAKVKDQHVEAMDQMLNEDPFLSHMDITTDDLPMETDDETIRKEKTGKVLTSLLRSFMDMEAKAKEELDKVKNENDLGELRSIAMNNPDLVEASIVNQPNLSKRTCDVLESLHQGEKVSNRVSSALRVTSALVGGLTCPFTWGAGCAFAAAVQIPHVNELADKKNRALGEYFLREGSLEEYVDAEKEAFNAKALLGLEFVGIPVLGAGKLVLRSVKEARHVSRGVSSSDNLLDTVPRAVFRSGDEIAAGAKISKGQGNVEVFTVHGMGSSHSAIRVGDTVYHTGQGFGKSIGSSVPGAKGDFVAEPFENFLAREMKSGRTVEGLTLKVPPAEAEAMRKSAQSMADDGKAYSLFNSNCSQTVCDIATEGGARTIDVDRTFDPLKLRHRLNQSIGDKAVSQNIYGNPRGLGSSSRRRFLLVNALYGSGFLYGEMYSRANEGR